MLAHSKNVYVHARLLQIKVDCSTNSSAEGEMYLFDNIPNTTDGITQPPPKTGDWLPKPKSAVPDPSPGFAQHHVIATHMRLAGLESCR